MPHPASKTDPLSRREWLRIGGLGCLGLSLPSLLKAAPSATSAVSFGRAKSCVIIFLSGGPPQHETFDPKPGAPVEIRGSFKSIPSVVPGIHLSELLPKVAGITDQLAIIRSMTTEVNAHSSSGYMMLTGYPNPSKAESLPPSGHDWPSIAAVVGAIKPSAGNPLSSVVLPEPLMNNPNILWPGQNGGFMGPTWHPHVLKCDPTAARIHIEGMMPGISDLRLDERHDLLSQLDLNFRSQLQSTAIIDVDRMQQQAFQVLHSARSRAAFSIDQEPPKVRDQYGRHKFGQSVLLARRLVESGVRLVQVNWPREPGDTTAGSPLWDTHQNNAQRVRETLCPQFDQTFATFIQDLKERGLLDETLVVVMGEFGRSPTINKNGGRDHWGNVFSVVMAGAGIPGGQVIGASDAIGAMPADRPVRPADLAATIFHLLGISPSSEFMDPMQRPRRVTEDGVVMREVAA